MPARSFGYFTCGIGEAQKIIPLSRVTVGRVSRSVSQRLRTSTFQVQRHTLDLATFVSAARAVVNGRSGELTEEAGEQLQPVLASDDRQMERLRSTTAG